MNTPLFFDSAPFARIWGGRNLEELFDRSLPQDGQAYGESWEISDRPEFVSRVAYGKWEGESLHDLWANHREELFGKGYDRFSHFPLLCKILDAQDKLSIQVHPPASIAPSLDGDSKTEAWYIAEASPGATLYAGWEHPVTADDIAQSIQKGSLEQIVHAIQPARGESLFLPSGRIHALGAGLIVFEIQENSDTTYRLYDWNRTDDQGNPRELHIEKALQSINLKDLQPQMRPSMEGVIVDSPEFIMEQIDLAPGEEIALTNPEQFALLVIAEGSVSFGERTAERGRFLILPRHATPGTASDSGARVIRCLVPGE